MVNFYIQKFVILRNGKQIYDYNYTFLAEDTDPRLAGTELTAITWNNVLSKPEHFPFGVRSTKRGLQICWFFDVDCADIKQWKTPNETGISYYYEPAKKWRTNLETILKYHDSDLAIKYLVERGVNFMQLAK